ncbi:alpha/beta hydrolase [Flavihumibacter fluvii]|uniref:alpha/beta hydrolase n=1 Tax=Flavihumibacter fluvii TaxID=2838157 RepID=UPI001BDE3C30|nr:alpha/beta hydrolase [Flavihumibacter fluvii]ULQ52937.1 alpha/beta hydrolase [Flavihumibacter fluvii]
MTLDNGFSFNTLQLKPDYEGAVTATMIPAKANKGSRRAVLYLHGFIDYFFHPHMTEAFLEKGYDFYALELRKYGHSLLPHQHPNYCRSMDEYFEELDLAIEMINTQSNGSPLVLLGHSTGGLLSSYYMNNGNRKDKVTAMVLNSPFLELNEPLLIKKLAPFLAGLIAAISPYAKKDGAISPVYAQSVHKDFHGEWNFNMDWKPIKGFPAYFAWVNAITKAQHYLRAHSDIVVPVLLMYSSLSDKPATFTEQAHKADIVLNVADIASRGRNLGKYIDSAIIENGMHDLFLSPKPVRDNAFEKMFDWLEKTLP